jgi:hypothetical protein
LYRLEDFSSIFLNFDLWAPLSALRCQTPFSENSAWMVHWQAPRIGSCFRNEWAHLAWPFFIFQP